MGITNISRRKKEEGRRKKEKGKRKKGASRFGKKTVDL
jgi:hypothetical protein